MTIKPEAIEAAHAMARQQGLEISSGKMMLVLGAFLEAGGYELAQPSGDPDAGIDPEHVERMRLFDGYSRLVSIWNRMAEAQEEAAGLDVAEDDFQYKILYDRLFEGDDCLAVQVRTVLADMGRTLPDYYDPDTTYKEDSVAYINAVNEMIEGIRREIGTEEEPSPRKYGY